jgi:diguanylate cyclase (GGDEF)-like protein
MSDRPRFGLRQRVLLLVLVAVLAAVGLILTTVGEQRPAARTADQPLAGNLVLTAVVVLLALAAIALAYDLLILRRLEALVSVAERVTGGDLTARAAVRGGDEVALMARTFNDMAARLAERVDEAQTARDTLAERVTELNLLNRMGELLQSCLGLDEAYRVIGSVAGELFPQDSGAVLALSSSGNTIEVMATWGPRPMGETVFARERCWAIRNGQSHVVPDTRTGVLCGHLPAPSPAAYVCVPLVAQGETLGVLHVASPATSEPAPSAAADARRPLIEAVAAQIALSLANVRLREVLRSQSIRDPLTGLFNRRYMEETLEREVRRAERARRPLTVLLLDIDEFKHQNDNFGHDAGDAVLRELGALLARCLRREDVACRYGGDEFVLVLPDASLDTALRRADEIREAVKGLRVASHGRRLGAVTVSIGLAALPDHGLDREALLAAADTALYRAKREGRDRVSALPSIDEASPERATGWPAS